MTNSEEMHDHMEIESLLNSIQEYYGYDFRNYSKAHLKRRLNGFLEKTKISSLSMLQYEVLRSRDLFTKMLMHLSVNTTEMFRDPPFYQSLLKNVLPLLYTYPYLKIWHAGCSTGEEVYSMAILLAEANLIDRTQIYATDFNAMALEKAKEGIYPIKDLKTYDENYKEAGGKNSFSDYYTSGYDSIIMNQDVKRNILFATHNLTVDNVFSEMNLIMCRNVLIYFNTKLQNRVYSIFTGSLMKGGFLCLGSKEAFKNDSLDRDFSIIDAKFRIFKFKY